MSELEKVKLGKKTYYVDKRLGELRNVDNPHDKIELGLCDIMCPKQQWKKCLEKPK